MISVKEESTLHHQSIDSVNAMIKDLLVEVSIPNRTSNRDYGLIREKLSLVHGLMKVKKYL